MESTDFEVEYELAIEYEHGCRDCGEFWTERYHLEDEPPDTCPNCGSQDVYRCVGSQGFWLQGGGVGWCRDGYYAHNNRDGIYKATGRKPVETTKEEFTKDLNKLRES